MNEFLLLAVIMMFKLPGSRNTPPASLSSLNPTNFECLRSPSFVHSVNSVCATSSILGQNTDDNNGRLDLIDGEISSISRYNWRITGSTMVARLSEPGAALLSYENLLLQSLSIEWRPSQRSCHIHLTARKTFQFYEMN
jgi:hypothetical protein